MYPYSAGYWNAPLPPAPYYHPYYYLPQQGPPLSPGRKARGIHEYVAPPRVIDLNPFIDNASRGTPHLAVWDITMHYRAVHRLAGRKYTQLAPTHFDQAATRPTIRFMRITIPEFEYTFEIDSGDLGFVTLGDLFRGIYSALRVEYPIDDWEALHEEEQMMIHDRRCARLAREPASYELESAVRRIDGFMDRIIFQGLKQIGPVSDMLWELKLGKPKPPKEKRRF